MARRRFNPNQKRDSHGRWTSGGSSAGSSRSRRIGKALFNPKGLNSKQLALHVGIAIAPLALAGTGALIGKADTFIQSATQNRIANNAANYERAKRAATFGIRVAKSAPANFAKKRGGVYDISSMSGRKV